MWTAFVLFVPFVVKNANPNRGPILQANPIAIEVNPSHPSVARQLCFNCYACLMIFLRQAFRQRTAPLED